MTQEREPKKEAQIQYFSPLVASMINWVVFNFDERKAGTLSHDMAGDLGIDITKVKDTLSRLEKDVKGDRVKTITFVVKVAVSSQEIDVERIPTSPSSVLSKRETELSQEFSKGSQNSEICQSMGLPLDQLNTLRTGLFKKFNTRSRYLVVAYNEAEKIRK